MNGIPPFVRAMLVCPKCRGELTDTPKSLDCPACKLTYPVAGGVPQLIPEAAKKLGAHPRVSR